MHRLLYRVCVLIVLAGIGGALSVRGQAHKAVNHQGGVALQGYDAVAYFTDHAAVKGSPSFTHAWNGVRWQFASAANRDTFASQPERYAPAFGGYCAYGVSRGYTVDVDPEAFAVVDGTLYLNYSKGVQRTWNQDRAGYIEKARRQWTTLLPGLQ